MKKEQRVAIISGGTRGIGRAVVLQLLSEGYRVATFSRDRVACAQLTQDLSTQYPAHQFLVLQGNVTRDDDVARVIDRVIKKFKMIDIVFNNAGFGYFSAADTVDLKRVQEMIETNIIGVMRLTKMVLPGMKRRRRGQIITMSSVSGKSSNVNAEFYAATKFAVNGYVDGLRKEVQPYGIKVATVSPGMIRTDFFDKKQLAIRKARNNGVVPQMLDVTDIARLVSLICSQSVLSDIYDIHVMPIKN